MALPSPQRQRRKPIRGTKELDRRHVRLQRGVFTEGRLLTAGTDLTFVRVDTTTCALELDDGRRILTFAREDFSLVTGSAPRALYEDVAAVVEVALDGEGEEAHLLRIRVNDALGAAGLPVVGPAQFTGVLAGMLRQGRAHPRDLLWYPGSAS